MDDILPVGGTLIWYLAVCRRQVWLMGHQVTPDESDSNIEYGRYLHQHTYEREKKDAAVGANRLDFLRWEDGAAVVVEVKKSSRAVESARLQLAHYLLELEERGIAARGELRFPEEKRRECVTLNDELRQQVRRARAEVRAILGHPVPPAAARTGRCRVCAYAELCWS